MKLSSLPNRVNSFAPKGLALDDTSYKPNYSYCVNKSSSLYPLDKYHALSFSQIVAQIPDTITIILDNPCKGCLNRPVL
jgi:hypothetical protein